MRNHRVRYLMDHHTYLRRRSVTVHRAASIDLDVVGVADCSHAHPLVCAISHEVGVFPDIGRELGDRLTPYIRLCGNGRAEGIERRERRRRA